MRLHTLQQTDCDSKKCSDRARTYSKTVLTALVVSGSLGILSFSKRMPSIQIDAWKASKYVGAAVRKDSTQRRECCHHEKPVTTPPTPSKISLSPLTPPPPPTTKKKHTHTHNILRRLDIDTPSFGPPRNVRLPQTLANSFPWMDLVAQAPGCRFQSLSRQLLRSKSAATPRLAVFL